MAFIVEDGTGLVTATSYLSEADADLYHADRENVAWAAAVTSAKEAALILATDFLDTRYRFLGIRKTDVQALAWPRDAAFEFDGRRIDPDSLPVALERATAELAALALSQTLQPTSSGGATTGSQSAGGLSVSIDASHSHALPIVRKATAYLRDLIAGDELLRA